MPRSRTVGRRRSTLMAMVVAAAMTTPVALLTASGADANASASPSSKTSLYIVQVTGDPVATYDGGVASFSKTKPGKGEKVNVHSAAARSYSRHLDVKHDQTLSRAGLSSSAKVRDYSVVLNGFAAELTAAQATSLAHTSGVLHVWKNEIRSADTTTTPRFLGLDGPDGTWAKQFGGPAHAGEGVIIGDIDSGFTRRSPSVTARGPPPTPSTPDRTPSAQSH